MSPRAVKLRLIDSVDRRGDDGGREADDPLDEHGAAPAAVLASEPSGPLGELPDEALVALLARGEMAASGILYRRHAGFAFNLAVRIAGSASDAEDVVHDAFLRAFGHLDSLRNPRAFRSWLGSIVVHGMRSRLRRARLIRLFGLGRAGDPVDLDSVVSPQAPTSSRAELAQIYALLRTMAPDDRIAWTLRYVEKHDLKETAALCDCSLATVKRRILRAQRYMETHFVDSSSPQSRATPRARRRTK